MKNMRTRNFEDTKSLIKTLVVLAVICCVGCLFFTQEGSVLQGDNLQERKNFIAENGAKYLELADIS